MNEFSQVQLRTFRTFLTFSLLILFTSLSIMVSNSQKFRISEIEYVLDNQLEFQSLNLLYGKSIWFVDENSFDQVYKDNPEVKNLSITKEIPNKLIITFDLYEKLTNIVDLRSSIKNIIILYENTFTANTDNINKNLPIVEISNGPVQDGFNGKLLRVNDTENLIDAIRFFLNNKSEVEKIGKNAFGFFNDNFCTEKHHKNLFDKINEY